MMTYGIPPQAPNAPQKDVPLRAKQAPRKVRPRLKAEHQEKIQALIHRIVNVVTHIFQFIQTYVGKILKNPPEQNVRKVIKALEERLFGKKQVPPKNVDRPILENLKAEMAKTGDRVEKFGQSVRNLHVFAEPGSDEADNIAFTMKVSKVSAKLPSPQQEELIELANQAFGESINSLRDLKNLIHKEAGVAISQKTSDDAEQCAQAAALIKNALDAFKPQPATLETQSTAYLSTLTEIKQSFIDKGLYTEKDGDVEQILKLQAYLLSDTAISEALDAFVNQQGIHLENYEMTFNLDDFHGVILYHQFMNQFPLGVSLHKQLRQIFLEFSLGNLV